MLDPLTAKAGDFGLSALGRTALGFVRRLFVSPQDEKDQQTGKLVRQQQQIRGVRRRMQSAAVKTRREGRAS